MWFRPLYYQTVHQRPMAFGYISRVPESVAARDRDIQNLVDSWRFHLLWTRHQIRYLVLRRLDFAAAGLSPASVLWSDSRVVLIDLDAPTPDAPAAARP